MGLSKRQKLALARSVCPINIWYGSVRSSKTFAQIWDFIARMSSCSGEGVNIVIGYSINTVWRNIFQPILSRPEFAAVAPHLSYRRSAPEGTIFGKPFAVVGANNEASWLAIQGLTIENAWGDEAVGWPRSFWDMLVSRLSLPTSRLLVTCNPGTASHYLKELIDSDDPEVHTEKFLLESNPTLSDSYVNRLKRMYSGLFYRRMILAEWVAAEGAVFVTFDEKTMVVDTLPSDLVLLAGGLDYGTNHPSAGYKISVQPATGQLFLHSEWSPNPGEIRLTDNQLADSFEPWLESGHGRPRYLYADPAAASFRQELHMRGVKTTRADNAVVPGINRVNALLVSGVLKIHRECEQLLAELPEYRWDSKAIERGNDAPVKENDDHVDAMRYTVYSSRGVWRKYLNKGIQQALDTL